MSVLFMFPGQGAQREGMLHQLPHLPNVEEILDQTSLQLGFDCMQLDTVQALQSTYAVQLCLLITGVAMANVFAEQQIFPDMVTGLSIGAYPAAVVAGALAYADALTMVQKRASLMEQAYPTGYGMTAIHGLNRIQIERILAVNSSFDEPVYLANLNAPRQMAIAGSDVAMQKIAQQAVVAGATKVTRLSVNVPSHCPLFEPSAIELAASCASLPIQRPGIVYLSANAARAMSDPTLIKTDLIQNMARQVHWVETSRLAWERGARLAIEMPVGQVLTRLTNSLWTEGTALACDDSRMDTLCAMIRKEQQSH